MQMVAAAWLVLQLTGSGVALGIDTALAFGPILLFGPSAARWRIATTSDGSCSRRR